MRVNIARSIATEMIRPFGVTVVSNNGVFGVCCIPGSAAVYSSQAYKGHRGEPVSAGMGTGVLPFCVCSDLVHFSATMILVLRALCLPMMCACWRRTGLLWAVPCSIF